MTGDASLRSFFFPADPAGAGAALSEAAAGVNLGGLTPAARKALLTEVGEEAAKVLDLGIDDIFRGVWDKYKQLLDAAERTAAAPGSVEAVPLLDRRMSFEDGPGVEVRIADLPPFTIPVVIALEITVHGLSAVVGNALLKAVRAGSADVTGTLTIAGQLVAEQQATIDLPGVLRFGEGIPLGEPPGTGWHRRSELD
ncbi:hypothetical protein ACFQS1_37580 [Paractinoplanes rhizophilus]|jgi:hypothetical protein|uniref:Uncharacterized protein n=1 Tax=Paractinoplanes rhizophilus TaxID=1416877 RepID=A0ABW2I480_9ACTN|nr:hypothetical protein [Actinoplanes sp.]